MGAYGIGHPHKPSPIYRPPQGDPRLMWSPPALSTPNTINIANDGSNRTPVMSAGQDYVVNIDDFNPASGGGITLSAGRHCRIIGGRISLNSYMGSNSANTALKIRDFTGTVHIEGIEFAGDYIWDCLVTQGAPSSTAATILQVQNCRLRSCLPIGHTLSEGHPDTFQQQADWPGQYRFDRVTTQSAYQGIFLAGIAQAPNPSAGMTICRSNIHPIIEPGSGAKDARYVFWQSERTQPVTLLDLTGEGALWIDTNPTYTNFTFGNDVYPQINGGRNDVSGSAQYPADAPTIGTDNIGRYLQWPSSANITGRVYEGVPPLGDFCPAGVPGRTYVSPGYIN